MAKPLVRDTGTQLPSELASGQLDLPADPSSALGAATKQYVDAVLSSTGVSAGAYGNSTYIATFTVDTKGRLSAAGSVAAAGGGGASGTVTSVALSLPGDLTVTGSPVTASGTLTAVRASQVANLFLASPNGSAGAPTYRAIVSSDIPTLNQNTTGSAATLTTARTISGVSFNGSTNITIPYSGLSGLPTLGTAAATASSSYATAAQGTEADNAMPKSGGAFTGAVTSSSTLEGTNLSGTNTGDQNLSGYALLTGAAFSGNVTVAGQVQASGVTLGNSVGASITDLTKGIALWGSTGVNGFGMVVTSATLNLNSGDTNINFNIAGTTYGTLTNTTGLSITGAGSFTGAISASNLSGTNTGDQTTITGNAGTATVLATARTISGVAFDGSVNITIPYSGLSGTPTIPTTLPPNGSAGGVLTGSYPNPSGLAATAVTAGTYGNSTYSFVGVVGADGRLTGASTVAISGGGGGGAPSGSAGGSLAGSYPNPTLATSGVTSGAYGNSTYNATFTVSSEGRITAASSVAATVAFSGNIDGGNASSIHGGISGIDGGGA